MVGAIDLPSPCQPPCRSPTANTCAAVAEKHFAARATAPPGEPPKERAVSTTSESEAEEGREPTPKFLRGLVRDFLEAKKLLEKSPPATP